MKRKRFVRNRNTLNTFYSIPEYVRYCPNRYHIGISEKKKAPETAYFRCFRSCVYYSNSSLPSCCVVFFVAFDGRNQGVLSDFYVLRGFLRDCIVILLSHNYYPLTQKLLVYKSLSTMYNIFFTLALLQFHQSFGLF